MRTTKYNEIVVDENDLCGLAMQGLQPWTMSRLMVEPTLDIERLLDAVEDPASLHTWTFPESADLSVTEFHASRQQRWIMPDAYKSFDIAKFVLERCQGEAELQRCGEELLRFQELGLFDLLRYLKYLVDVMTEHSVIWGVGRGSSTASFVLYKIGVHRINSLFYNLDHREFLR